MHLRSFNKAAQKLEVRRLPLSTGCIAQPNTGEVHVDVDDCCGEDSEMHMDIDSDTTETDCSENGCVGSDDDEQDENVVAESDSDDDMIDAGEEASDIDVPDWARWIWRMMVLYWIAIMDGEDDHAYELEDQFRVYGRKKGLDYMFFLLRTQTVRFQLTALADHKDLDITVILETGALNNRKAEDRCILELLGEHIQLQNREDVRRRAGLVEWKLIENDWEAICENRGITAKSYREDARL
ncbi:hypothetical protein RUND412_007552 [Rhizina undulata]